VNPPDKRVEKVSEGSIHPVLLESRLTCVSQGLLFARAAAEFSYGAFLRGDRGIGMLAGDSHPIAYSIKAPLGLEPTRISGVVTHAGSEDQASGLFRPWITWVLPTRK
jgi:hypothetical protein